MNAADLMRESVLTLSIEVREVVRLQLSCRSKIAISSLFILGSFVIVASGLRIGSMIVDESSGLTCASLSPFKPKRPQFVPNLNS